MSKLMNPATLYVLLSGYADDCDGFKVVDDTITSSDSEDGGADHYYVIQEDSTKKFYGGYYCDWDIDNTSYNEEEHTCGDRVDLECDLKEVFAKTVTHTIYE